MGVRNYPPAPSEKLADQVRQIDDRLVRFERRRRPVTKLRRVSGTAQTITNNTWTPITTWEATAERDDVGLWPGSGNYLEVPAGWGGEWRITVLSWWIDTTSYLRTIGISVNHASSATHGWVEDNTARGLQYTREINLSATDKVRMMALHTKGSDATFGTSDNRIYPRIEMRFVDF